MLYLNMKLLPVLIFLFTGCALKENESAPNGLANIEKIALFNQSYNNSIIIAQGYYWPSYEGSVICQTREFEICLLVVLNENNYKKYANKFEKGDFVMVSGSFEWIDMAVVKKKFENSTEIIPYYPFHRLVGVKFVKRISN